MENGEWENENGKLKMRDERWDDSELSANYQKTFLWNLGDYFPISNA